MKLWKWEKSFDDDGHPMWIAKHDGTSTVIWRAGGDTGDYALEWTPRRYPDLASAKKAAREQWDS